MKEFVTCSTSTDTQTLYTHKAPHCPPRRQHSNNTQTSCNNQCETMLTLNRVFKRQSLCQFCLVFFREKKR